MFRKQQQQKSLWKFLKNDGRNNMHKNFKDKCKKMTERMKR